MQVYMPFVDDLLGSVDSPAHVMCRDGDLVGFNPQLTRFVWRFGYIPGSIHSKAHNVQCEKGFLWVLCDINGNAPGSRMKDPDEVRHAWPTFWGFGCELPPAFKAVLRHKKGKGRKK